jgi:DNA-nicking Smr family endonuclease
MKSRKKRAVRYTPVIDAELDLHGYTSSEARSAVEELLSEANSAGWQRIRIVVGKGTRSMGGVPILPDVVKAVLIRHGHDYTYAKVFEGGEGVLVVTLKG